MPRPKMGGLTPCRSIGGLSVLAVAFGKVVGALHFVKSADRPFEFEATGAGFVELFR